MGRRPSTRNNFGSLAMLAAMRRASSLGAMLSIPPASRSLSIRRNSLNAGGKSVEGLQTRECSGWRGAKPAAGRDSLQRRQ